MALEQNQSGRQPKYVMISSISWTLPIIQFWTSFYEQAAQIRIPTSDDHSTVNEFPSENKSSTTSGAEAQDDSIMDGESETSEEDIIHPSQEPTITTTESSFHPNQDAFSSTPATARAALSNDNAAQNEETPSWSASLESPFVRLSHEVKNFSLKDENMFFTSSAIPNLTSDESTPSIQPVVAQMSLHKEEDTPLREKATHHQLYSVSDMSSIAATSRNISPLKPRSKLKTPIPKDMNPYVPPGTDSRNWDGLVDLRDPSTATLRRSRHIQSSSSLERITAQQYLVDEDKDLDTLSPGMSAPVMMSPIRRQKTDVLAPTPVKGASMRIKQDILRSVQRERQYGGTIESSMSTMPTPPSFSRYQDQDPPEITNSLTDPSFSSMMRRVGLEVPTSSAPGFRGIVDDSATPVYDDLDSDDSIMDDYIPAPNHAAFLMGTHGMRHSDDDSFGSNQSSDSLNDEDALLEGTAPVHPFAEGIEDTGDDDSDSFEDYPPADGVHTETLFGVAPGQRQAMVHPREQPLRMLGQELLDNVTVTDTCVGGTEESPTPVGWGGNR